MASQLKLVAQANIFKTFNLLQMIELIIALALLLCPNPFHTAEDHGSCNKLHIGTISTTDDTGGETGGNPKPPPPPTPPGG